MHRFDRRLRVAMLALAASALTFGSIGASSSDGALNASTGTTVQAQTCKQQGALRYGLAGGGVNNLDPAISNLANRVVIMPLLYPSLTKLRQDGTVVPDLATKWRHSADLKTWWFYLKRNIRYADGRQFDADDVVANVLRNLDPKVGSGARRFINDIRSVRAITKYQVRFKLGSPSAILPDALYLVKMVDVSDVSRLATQGNGPGPYKVARYVPNNTLTLVPNPFYFGPKPCLRSITIIAQPDTTSMVTAFRSRKLDMIWQFPATAVSAIQGTRDAVIIKPRTVSTAHVLEVDTTSPPFDNPVARRALSYAMNRTAMVRAAFLGEAQASVANSPISVTSPAYNKKLPKHTFNLNRARQLFTQAGIKPGTKFTYWAQAGKRPEWITNGQILQQDLRKIGINLEIEQADPATWVAKFNPSPKKFPNLIVATFLSLQPAPALGLSAALKGCDCNWGLVPGTPYPRYYSMVLQSLGVPDPAKRQGLYDRLQSMFNQESPFMVIAHQSNLVAAHKSVNGAWEDPSGNMHLESARIVP
ncbi:MAG: ABC transporter substrate-binding protein [Gaiellaceae bacterium MAG52_C11]|nr:ABC transporter substrate-binding protein [Candidatus Gaiellasilicea maunaloa]